MNPSEAKRWMDYAKSDFDAAHTLLNSGEFFPRQICFMAQQAGEKALKAIVVEHEARETLRLAESVFDAVKEEFEKRF